jgi:hypothetical protein
VIDQSRMLIPAARRTAWTAIRLVTCSPSALVQTVSPAKGRLRLVWKTVGGGELG